MSGEDRDVLIREFKLSQIGKNQLHYVFKSVQVNDLPCPVCKHELMVADLPCKSNPKGKVQFRCPVCFHRLYGDIEGVERIAYDDCSCAGCKNSKGNNRLHAESKLSKSVLERLEKPVLPIGEASFADLINMFTLIYSFSDRSLVEVLPLKYFGQKFWPVEVDTLYALNSLIENNWIIPNYQSVPNKPCEIVSVDLRNMMEVSWMPVLGIDRSMVGKGSAIDTINILDREIEIRKKNTKTKSEVRSFQLQIAVSECTETYLELASRYGFEGYAAEGKIVLLYHEMLGIFPVKDVINFTEMGVRDAAAYAQEASCISKESASKAIMPLIERAVSKRKTASNAEQFARKEDLNRSRVSIHFYRRMGYWNDVAYARKLHDISL